MDNQALARMSLISAVALATEGIPVQILDGQTRLMARKGNQRTGTRYFTDNAKRSEKGVLERHKIPGRNDKCVCGSGKKYKNCCFRST
jgi:uncharacterized protein YecA (UPF0149 family)